MRTQCGPCQRGHRGWGPAPGDARTGQKGLEGAERLGDKERPSEHKAASWRDRHGKCLQQRGL